MIVLVHAFVLSVLASCSDQSTTADATKPEPLRDKDARIELSIKDAGNDLAKLLGVFGNQNYLVDSVRADAEGNFVFAKDSALPTGFYYLMLASDNSYFQLLLDADQHFSMETVKGDLVNAMKVTGSVDNELLYQNLKFEAEFAKRLDPMNAKVAQLQAGTAAYNDAKAQQDALVAERLAHVKSFEKEYPNAFFTKFKLSGQNPDLSYPKLPNGELDQVTQVYRYRKAFFDNVDFNADWTLRTPVYANKLRKYIKEITPQNADSLIRYADELIAKTKNNKELFKFTVNWIALEYKTPKTMGTEGLYVHLIEKYWTADLAFWSNPEEIKGLRGEVSLMKPSLLGMTGQDIIAKNEKGETVSLYGIGGKMKVLYIYSYDCEHCQKETPDMVRVYNEWKAKGLTVFTLSIDENQAKWLDFVRKNNMPFTNAIDPKRESRYDRKYHIDITPELYVLDANNRIIASNLSPAQLPEFLQQEQARKPWH